MRQGNAQQCGVEQCVRGDATFRLLTMFQTVQSKVAEIHIWSLTAMHLDASGRTLLGAEYCVDWWSDTSP